MTVREQIEKAYIEVEDNLIVELTEAISGEEIHNLLYIECERVINQHNYEYVTADRLVQEFKNVYSALRG